MKYALVVRVLGATLVACADGGTGAPNEREPTAALSGAASEPVPFALDPLAPPLLPHDEARFAPSQVAIADGGSRSGHELADVERCSGCHAGVAASYPAP
jgi:hypothetical protein